MAPLPTVAAVCARAESFFRRCADRIFERPGIKVVLRLDKASPGAHLVWDVTNTGAKPVALIKFIIHARNGPADMATTLLPATLASRDRIIVPTDVDWTLLAARSIAVVDAEEQEHYAARSQLAGIQEELRELIDRRIHTSSARDFLAGAADLAFGVAILGLGFFMLMWVIATG
jgi:hypothetical protein